MKVDWPYLTPGIPDHFFLRGDVPMTKEEVRAVTLAKARLAPGQVVWDIGSGTGSLTVEAARLVGPNGKVFAIERLPEALSLTRRNAELWGLSNVVLVPGEAPSVLHDLPVPERVFVGGSGGRLETILELLQLRLKLGGRVVINAVTLETAVQALNGWQPPWQVEVVQVSVARGTVVGERHLLRSLNPVFIISAEKGEDTLAG